MEKSIESVRRNFNTVRTGRANVSILDRIQASLAARVQAAQPHAPAAALRRATPRPSWAARR